MCKSDDYSNDEYLMNAGIDKLGGAHADENPSVGISREQSERLERETKNPTPAIEDMSGNDSPDEKSSSNTMVAKSLTGWHPFMRFLFRVADMEYAHITPREERAYRFIEEHKRTFWACFWGDWIIVLVGSMGVIAAIAFAALRTVGIDFGA
ncbi:hypothetical protein ACLUXI_00530 [Bifidobacterium apri]|uniref:hypothetical protein n=1 Tax=Bifidobacterium apri TaxID=1769423 RepID=UPI003991C8AD